MVQEGGQVWHERWGEDYDGEEGCVKWTDKVITTCIFQSCLHANTLPGHIQDHSC